MPCWLREATGTAFRLIGIGANPLLPLGRGRSRRSGGYRDAPPRRRAGGDRCAAPPLRRNGDQPGTGLDQRPDQASGGAAAIGISRASGWSPVPGARTSASSARRLRPGCPPRRRTAGAAGRFAAGRSADPAAPPGSSRSGCGNSARRAGSSFPPSPDRRRWSRRGRAGGTSRTAAATFRGCEDRDRCCRTRGCG